MSRSDVTLTWMTHVQVGPQVETCGIGVSSHAEFIFDIRFGHRDVGICDLKFALFQSVTPMSRWPPERDMPLTGIGDGPA